MTKGFAHRLREYVDKSLGFGNPNAPLWFVGPEQGGGASIGEVKRRVEAWHKLGAKPFCDAPEFHGVIGEGEWHGASARIQSTWGKLIRISLAAQGGETGKSRILDYQRSEFARSEGSYELVGDLMPLPCRGMKEWIYADLAPDVPELRTRETYSKAFTFARIDRWCEAIALHQPKCVVFFGLGLKNKWHTILSDKRIGAEAQVGPLPSLADEHRKRLWPSRRRTLFLVVEHPCAYGASSQSFDSRGRFLREQLLRTY